MPYDISLPKDKQQLEETIAALVKRGKSLRNPQAIRWWIAHWYMMGARNFSNLNYQEGTVQVAYYGNDMQLRFIYEEIVAKYQNQLGRLLGIDISPTVNRRGISLDGLRKSSIAQMALNSILPDDKINELRLALFPMLLHYGTIGLGAWREDEDSMGIEIIPPWELLPIPPDCIGEPRGLIRSRHVPLDWVKGLLSSPAAQSTVWGEMEVREVPTGDIPGQVRTRFEGSVLTEPRTGTTPYKYTTDRGAGKPRKDETMTKLVEFIEVWIKTTDGYLDEYLTFAGGRKLSRDTYRDHRMHMPVSYVPDIRTNSFWGRSFVDLMIPLNTELERSIGQLFQNIQDWDLYGGVLWPTTIGVSPEWIEAANGLKYIAYEPDYSAPNSRPEPFQPHNTGMWPVKSIEAGVALMDRIANQPQSLMKGEAPGRVDSSSGLGFLYETSGVPLIPTAKGVAAGLTSMYKALLGYARDTWGHAKMLSVSQLDDALAGITFDQTTGEISLSKNPLPHPDEVVIQIASEVPRSPEREKLELKEARDKGVLSPIEYVIEVRKKGLDLPIGIEGEAIWNNYRRAMLENLILFGDGESTTGEVIVSERDHHTVHLMVLNQFMAKPEFYAASPAVREKFEEHHTAHEAGLGKLPEDMPLPEDAAEFAAAEQPAMQAGAGF